ncbi:PLP-dependent aminotransferase family protein [Hwanghaeella sp.]|uniref:MocR-like pyridoxine biosynthesis transcription factor PdxR n=1 Tax=Hwanghaeella sp. TaxID=2605943 RepID=UPI003CCBFE18
MTTRLALRTTKAAVLPISLDRTAEDPLHRQLYEQLRETILTGRLQAGSRLPATRTLARDLDISRNTVTAAFDQLLAEGYLEGRVGAGTFVTSELPEEALSVIGGPDGDGRGTALHDIKSSPRQRGLSRRGTQLAGLRRRRTRRGLAFAPGVPELRNFPFDIWARLMARAWRRPPMDLMANTEPAGYMPLRRAIADYVRTARGVRCEVEQVIIVSGAQQAIGLAAHVLLDEGDRALVEDPGYPGVRGALMAAGVTAVPTPVDGEGLDIVTGEAKAPDARFVCVAPSHQYPLGVTMSLARRLALLDWAQRVDGWIIEDDYDSEYRYSGKPLAALQGLDRDNRVVYVGSFSKTMFPSLRLGYLIVPPDLTDSFRFARAALDDHPSTVAQPALTAFIEDGYFAAHLRRMRKLYAQRQALLVSAVRDHMDDLLTIAPAEAGMHILARQKPQLTVRMDDIQATRRAEAAGITVSPLSSFFHEYPAQQGLMLGYAAVDEDEIPKAVIRLSEALRQ